MIPPVILSALLECALTAKGPGGLPLKFRLQLAVLALEQPLPEGPLRDAVVRLLRSAVLSAEERAAAGELLAQVGYANRVAVAEAPRVRADLDG